MGMNAQAMKNFETLKGLLGKAYGVADVSKQFAVAPTIEQRLQDKIVAQSDFLQKINVVPVTDLKGENIFGAASGPVTGRTNTSVDGKERATRDVLSLTNAGYELFATESDVHITFNTIDAWSKFPDLAARYTAVADIAETVRETAQAVAEPLTAFEKLLKAVDAALGGSDTSTPSAEDGAI